MAVSNDDNSKFKSYIKKVLDDIEKHENRLSTEALPPLPVASSVLSSSSALNSPYGSEYNFKWFAPDDGWTTTSTSTSGVRIICEHELGMVEIEEGEEFFIGGCRKCSEIICIPKSFWFYGEIKSFVNHLMVQSKEATSDLEKEIFEGECEEILGKLAKVKALHDSSKMIIETLKSKIYN